MKIAKRWHEYVVQKWIRSDEVFAFLGGPVHNRLTRCIRTPGAHGGAYSAPRCVATHRDASGTLHRTQAATATIGARRTRQHTIEQRRATADQPDKHTQHIHNHNNNRRNNSKHNARSFQYSSSAQRGRPRIDRATVAPLVDTSGTVEVPGASVSCPTSARQVTPECTVLRARRSPLPMQVTQTVTFSHALLNPHTLYALAADCNTIQTASRLCRSLRGRLGVYAGIRPQFQDPSRSCP